LAIRTNRILHGFRRGERQHGAREVREHVLDSARRAFDNLELMALELLYQRVSKNDVRIVAVPHEKGGNDESGQNYKEIIRFSASALGMNLLFVVRIHILDMIGRALFFVN